MFHVSLLFFSDVLVVVPSKIVQSASPFGGAGHEPDPVHGQQSAVEGKKRQAAASSFKFKASSKKSFFSLRHNLAVFSLCYCRCKSHNRNISFAT